MTDLTTLTFQEDGSPYSTQFDDIYFDTAAGTSQSECVFIKGNNLIERFKEHKGKFVIAETGFGTGLNFLLTWQVIQQLNTQRNNHEKIHLHFISVEKYPLSKAQLSQSLKILPQLAEFSHELISQYPENTTENVILNFDTGHISLELIFDDATQGLAQVCPQRGRVKPALVDAWFLDGFSPNKNPEMWQNALFQQISRLSKEQATLATFTVSGNVKRQLISAGFRVEKRLADGKKNEMLVGIFQQNPQSGKGYQQREVMNKPQHVSIIGGGIASACAAYALTRAGVKVTLYCQDFSVAQGASSNNIGALYPLIHQQKDEISVFYQKAFIKAVNLYQSVAHQGFSFDHDWCGLLEISYKPALELRQKHIENSNIWPHSLIHSVTAQQASEHAKIPLKHGGLFIPKAGWIAPAQLVKALFKAAEKTNRLRIETGHKIKLLSQKADNKWLIKTDKDSFNASVVIYCGGAQGITLDLIEQLPLTSVRGQVTSMATNESIENLSTVICHKGYLTPKNNQVHCIGATFEKNSFDTEACAKDDIYNLKMLEKCLPEQVTWKNSDIVSSKARLRCMTPDHMPIVGAMPDIDAHKQQYAHLSKDKRWRYNELAPVISNLFMLTGLGARGLCSAPLLAEILTADICGTPYPLNNTELFNLAPNRFVVRDIIRRKFDL